MKFVLLHKDTMKNMFPYEDLVKFVLLHKDTMKNMFLRANVIAVYSYIQVR